MATIVNTPGTNSDSSGVSGIVIGLVLAIILFLLFWFFGMPYFRGTTTESETPATTIENTMEAPDQAPTDGGDTTINVPVPDEVDVNVQNEQPQQ